MSKTIFANIGSVGNIVSGDRAHLGDTIVNGGHGAGKRPLTKNDEAILQELRKVQDALSETEKAVRELRQAIQAQKDCSTLFDGLTDVTKAVIKAAAGEKLRELLPLD